jgi:hypothetical protein
MVSARPPLLFSSPAVAHLLPPSPAHRYTCPFSQLVRFLYYRTCPIQPSLADRWAHPFSEPGRLIPLEARPGAAVATSPASSHRPDDPSSPVAKRIGAVVPLPRLPVSPPHFLPTRNGFAIEVPPCRRWLLLDRPPPVVPRPIKAVLENRLHTTVPALASIRSTHACVALPPSSTHRRLHSSTSGTTIDAPPPFPFGEDPESLLSLFPHRR